MSHRAPSGRAASVPVMLSFMPAWIWAPICCRVSFGETLLITPTRSRAPSVNAAAVKRAQTLGLICRRPGAGGGPSRNREEEETEEFETPLPYKPRTEDIIGGIIGVIIVLAIIGMAIFLYRKFIKNGPPKYKPPSPRRADNSATRLNEVHASGPEGRLLQNEYYITQSAEPVTDLDGLDDYSEEKKEHYVSAAPSGWDDPENGEARDEVPYMEQTGSEHQGVNVQRGDSFVSPAVFV